jgi:hypothetical protein
MGRVWGGEGRDLNRGPLSFWEQVGAKGATFYRVGPVESEGSNLLRSKFTRSWPFFTGNVFGGGGAGIRSDPFCSRNVREQKGSLFIAFGPSSQKLFAFNREKR